jgi:hypothetical protein
MNQTIILAIKYTSVMRPLYLAHEMISVKVVIRKLSEIDRHPSI